jgi:hypothetical protein
MQTFFSGPSMDFWLNNDVCSVTVTVPKGQKFVVLTQVWNYATAAKAPVAWDETESADFTVTVTGLAQPYTLTKHGDIHTPPPAEWTKDGDSGNYSYWHLNIVNAFDVSSLTQANSIMLTLQLQITIPETPGGYGYLNFSPLSVDLGLYGGTSLKLTQTSSSFRPRDSRDPAAQCSTNDGDCHPQFTATLAGLESFVGSLRDYDETPVSILSPAIRFTLAPGTVPPSAQGAGPWLAGTSTNYGPDSDADPDYVFEMQTAPHLTVQGPLTMQTDPGTIGVDGAGIPVATPPISFKVTSRDFGGKAYLRTALTLAPGVPPIYAEIVDANGQDVTPPVDNAATKGTCGTDFTQYPFASLPVDQDCNGIADSWEDANSTQNGAHLPPDWDQEPGYDGTTKGDGYSVHDEYRGFHYIDDVVNTSDPTYPDGHPRWASTDPLKVQDVFFWDSFVAPSGGADPCVAPAYTPPASPQWSTLRPNCVTTAIRGMLAQQTSSFMTFRRVSPMQAHSISGTDPTQGVNPLSRNSQYSSAGFALVYGSKPGDIFDLAQCDASPPQVGTIATSGGFSNDGTMINVVLPQVIACAYITRQSPAVAYAQDTYLQRVVAHETGHKFGLYHIDRFVTYLGTWHQGQLFPRVSDLPFSNYDIDDQASGTMYLRYDGFPYSRLDPRTNMSTPSTLLESLEGYPTCSLTQLAFAASTSTTSNNVYQLSYCAPSVIPRKIGPRPSGDCPQRYATQKDRDTRLLDYLLVHAMKLDLTSRGHLTEGMDMMGIFSPFLTHYTFDTQCGLPHLRVTALP